MDSRTRPTVQKVNGTVRPVVPDFVVAYEQAIFFEIGIYTGRVMVTRSWIGSWRWSCWREEQDCRARHNASKSVDGVQLIPKSRRGRAESALRG